MSDAPRPARRIPLVECAIGIIERNGCVLITQRRRDAHAGGLWEFPGGKRRPGESEAACLRRELREELGVAVRVGVLLTRLRYDYPERRVVLAVYRCRVTGGRPRAFGSAAMRWVARARLAEYEFPPANIPLLRLLTGQSLQC